MLSDFHSLDIHVLKQLRGADTVTIGLNDILSIAEPGEFKLHLAGMNDDETHPLDEYLKDEKLWIGWNEWRGNKNDWNRPYILSFMEYYPRTDAWLFGGGFRVKSRLPTKYVLEPIGELEKYKYRLVASFHRYQGMRGRAFLLENFLKDIVVSELLHDRYAGEQFCGVEKIDHGFNELEAIFKRERPDWKAALLNMKGVYAISDKSNGKHYVGAAYGDAGIWSRWSCYMGTCHGWNDGLVTLLKKKGPAYARTNFRFCVLEAMLSSTSDEHVLAREAHWKRTLLAREHGYNGN